MPRPVRPLWRITASGEEAGHLRENVKEIDLHNVKIEGYEGERLHFVNVGHFEED